MSPGLEPDERLPVEDALRSTAQTYDRIASAYAERAVLTPAQRAHLDRFAALLPPGGLVLDTGSGPGHLAAALAERGFRAVALDMSEQMLRLAVRLVPVVQGDLRRPPVRSGALDGLWSSASLLHVPRAEGPGTLRSWWNALVPGGVLGLSTAVGGDGEQGWEVVPYAADVEYDGPPPRRWFVYHSPDRLLGLLGEAGFDVLDVRRRESHRSWLEVVARR